MADPQAGTCQLGTRFNHALAFAADLHAPQRRKCTPVPYIAHLLAVSAIVLENGGDEDEAIGALLHDAVEDRGPHFPGGPDALRARIRDDFGQRVLDIVNACTDTDIEPKPDWRPRKERHIAHLAEASESVLLVVAADKLHNIRSIAMDHASRGEAVWDTFRKPREETLWYYRSMASLLRHRLTGRGRFIVDELCREIAGFDAGER